MRPGASDASVLSDVVNSLDVLDTWVGTAGYHSRRRFVAGAGFVSRYHARVVGWVDLIWAAADQRAPKRPSAVDDQHRATARSFQQRLDRGVVLEAAHRAHRPGKGGAAAEMPVAFASVLAVGIVMPAPLMMLCMCPVESPVCSDRRLIEPRPLALIHAASGVSFAFFMPHR